MERDDAIRQFVADVFEFKRREQYATLTERLYFQSLIRESNEAERLKKQFGGQWNVDLSVEIDKANQEQWDAKQPAIDAHTKVLASGEALKPLLAGEPAARKLAEFLFYLDWRTFRKDEAFARWPDLAIDLDLLLATPPIRPGKSSSGQAAGNGKKNVNARMLATIQENQESIGWNSSQWSRHLKCSTAAITTQPTWKDLEMRREREKAERAQDRRRKPKASDRKRG